MMWTWIRLNFSSIGGQVVGAIVTTVTLSFGFMIFNDYVSPPPDLTGRWKFTVNYKDTSRVGFQDLKVTYQVLLIQHRTHACIHGTTKRQVAAMCCRRARGLSARCRWREWPPSREGTASRGTAISIGLPGSAVRWTAVREDGQGGEGSKPGSMHLRRTRAAVGQSFEWSASVALRLQPNDKRSQPAGAAGSRTSVSGA